MVDAKSRGRIAFLDYLRIFAFTSVLIGHTLYSNLADLAAGNSIHPTVRVFIKALLPFVDLGGPGVVVFFLISGYIITLVVQSEKPLEYAIKRFFRIYPLYGVAVLLNVLMLARSGMNPPWPVVLQQLTLLGDFFNTPYSLGAVEWTLRIELVFYVLMGILAFISRRLAWFKPGRWPYFYALLVIVLGILPPLTSGKIGWGLWPATGAITLYFPFLLVGSMIYLYERKIISIWLLLFVSFYVFAQYYSLMIRYQPAWSHDHHAFLALMLFLLLWRFRERIKADGLILFISSLTYSVYLFHNWLYFVTRDVLTSRGVEVHVAMAFAFLFLFGVCIAALQFVEKPGIRLGRKVISILNNSSSPRV